MTDTPPSKDTPEDPAKDTAYVKDPLQLVLREREHINQWKGVDLKRVVPDPDDDGKYKTVGTDDPWGLAISGGGIRSATFSMGVLQALVSAGVLEKFHYLSTVSGGGYIGSSLTWFMTQKRQSPGTGKYFGVTSRDFPFGNRNGAGQHYTPQAHLEQVKKHGDAEWDADRSGILNHIRQRGNYMDPGNGLNAVSLIGMVLKSVIPSLLTYFTLFMPIMYLIYLFINRDTDLWNPATQVTAWVLLGFTAWALFYSFMTRVLSGGNNKPGESYRKRLTAQRYAGNFMYGIIATFIIGTVPVAHAFAHQGISDWISGGGLTAAGVAAGIGRLVMQTRNLKASRGLPGQIMTFIATILIVYGLLVLAYALSDWLALHANTAEGASVFGWHLPRATPGIYVAIILIFGVLVGGFANLNYIGLHRMYRDRLMETFLPDVEKVKDQNWAPANMADGAILEKFCGVPENPEDGVQNPAGPFHLINTNVVLTDSPNHRYRGRGGASFILSPLYSGSVATGWRLTAKWMKQKGSRGMTLPTAMAISGAALNPRTGADGKGVTRTPLVSFLMSLTNARLGYWAVNPRVMPIEVLQERMKKSGKRVLFNADRPPNFLKPGLSPGLFAQTPFTSGHHEKAGFIELTDGGHFDNMGIYELIRRQMKLIVLIDGSADPTSNFASLSNTIERIRVDFGVHIRFEDGAHDMRHVDPATSDLEANPLAEKFGLAKQGFAIARIDYTPPEDEPRPGEHFDEDGVLIYIKSTMIPGLPTDIYGYKSAHPEFPDESTADQFFDETQLEAYRELGYRIAQKALRDDTMMDLLGIE